MRITKIKSFKKLNKYIHHNPYFKNKPSFEKTKIEEEEFDEITSQSSGSPVSSESITESEEGEVNK